jgi:outer membrane protein assembly factor BamB
MSIHAARDGSIRVACSPPEDGSEGLGPPIMRIFAIDREGHPMRGWPVDIEDGSIAGIQGDDLAVTLRTYVGEGGGEGDVEPIGLAVIRADGQVRMGRGGVEATCCDSTTAIGPASAYLVNRAGDLVDTGSSELIAFGLDRVKWRTPIDGTASDPAFGANGNAYVSSWMPGLQESRMFVFDPDGHAVPFNAHSLPMVPTNGSAPAGPEHPAPPTVASGGSLFLLEEANDASILALDAAGTPRRGWPVNWASGVEHAGDCGQDTGCGLPTVMPAVGRDGSLYVALNATGNAAGGSLTALSPAGKVRSGWPVGLKRRGGQFWRVVAGSDGGIWTLAAEPDKDGYDATLLSIAPDSTIRGKVTLVEAAPIGP